MAYQKPGIQLCASGSGGSEVVNPFPEIIKRCMSFMDHLKFQ